LPFNGRFCIQPDPRSARLRCQPQPESDQCDTRPTLQPAPQRASAKPAASCVDRRGQREVPTAVTGDPNGREQHARREYGGAARDELRQERNRKNSCLRIGEIGDQARPEGAPMRASEVCKRCLIV